jgi:hypothetical protein
MSIHASTICNGFVINIIGNKGIKNSKKVDLNWIYYQMISVPFLTIYLGGNFPPQGKNLPPPPPVKPFLPPKCEAELLMIAVRIAVDLLDNEIMPFHSLLHSHLVCNSPSIS